MNRTCKILGLLGLVGFIVGANVSDPHEWATTYEDDPEAGDNVSQGDDWMRNIKQEVRRRMEVEHQMGSGAGPATDQGDNGAHRLGSARVFLDSSEPTTLSDFTELHDNTSPGSGSGTLSAVETNGNGGANDVAIGHGRLMVDAESYAMKVYDDVDAGAATAWAWKEVTAPRTGRRNLAVNGGFEDDGLIGIGLATCTDSFDTPARDDDPTASNSSQTSNAAADGFCDTVATFDGNAGYLTYVGPGVRGWSVLGSPTAYSLDATAASNGFGFEFTVSSDGAGDGIQQTLTDLNASTEYQVWVRAQANSSATCSLDVGGEGSTDLPVTTTSSSYVTLTGFFVTDATPTDITLELDETAGTGSCSWDHVVVQAVDPDDALRQASNWAYRKIDTTSAQAADALTTDSLTWGGDPCYWRIGFNASSDASGFSNGVDLEFDEDGDGVYTILRSFEDTNNSQDGASGVMIYFEEDFNDAAAAGADTDDAIVAGNSIRLRIVDGGAAGNIECDNDAACSMFVEQVCSY